ncbi:MAG: Gx transporter family protein [Lachnospiraceae bacterium]|nr:Gx transporter family protein [Lachnospiraceae bacterium]
MRQKSSYKIATLGLALTLALILGYVESLIILPVAIPGIKVGLSNLAVVFLLYRYGWKEALLVNTARILLSSLLFGSLMGLLFSASGALLSFLFMITVKRFDFSSPQFTSVVGGVTHNVGQLVAAMLLFSQVMLGYYLPVLLVAGLITGLLNGMLADILLKRIPDGLQINN